MSTAAFTATRAGTAVEPEQDIDKLLGQAEKLVKTFNPSVSTLDSHVRDTIGEVQPGDDDKAFVQQLFYGAQRYKKFLKIFLSSFYFNCSSKIQRSDYTRFMLLAYVSIFRLEELGLKRFRAIMRSQDPTKVHHFLSYLFDLHNINVWLKDEWVKVLDRKFVEGTLIANIEKRLPAVQQYLESNYGRAFGTISQPDMAASKGDGASAGGAGAGAGAKAAGGTKTRRRVKFNPPNLHPPKPRVAPEPMAIQQTAAANPVPKHLDRITMERINKEREESLNKTRAEVQAKYQNTEKGPFNLHQTRSNLEQVRAEVEAERSKELKFNSFRAKPPPKYPSGGADVKLNVAAVLREDALYKKKQEQDAALIKGYEAALRDSTEFYQWQTEMKGKDEAKRKAEVERRRLEMVASQKEAVEASERRRMENKMLAGRMKVESEALLAAAEAEEEDRLASNQALVDEVKEVRQRAPREAQEKLFASRVASRIALNEELEEARIRAEEEARLEQERKDDLIRQIRALERVPKQRVKMFDPTESSGVGLLEEMSLVELRERLELNKARLEEERSERRDKILRRKKEREIDLRARVANITRIRESAGAANHKARARRKKAEADKLEAERQERAQGNMKLAERLIAKRQARRREEAMLAEEAEVIAKQRMFLGAAKAAIEERHFEQQMLGAEREAVDRQESAQQAARAVENTKAVENNARTVRRKKDVRKQKELDASRHRRMEKDIARAYMQDMEEINEKKSKFKEERERALETLRIRDKINPYAATMSRTHVEKARTQTLRRSQTLQNSGRRAGTGDAGSVRSHASASKEVLQWAAM